MSPWKNQENKGCHPTEVPSKGMWLFLLMEIEVAVTYTYSIRSPLKGYLKKNTYLPGEHHRMRWTSAELSPITSFHGLSIPQIQMAEVTTLCIVGGNPGTHCEGIPNTVYDNLCPNMVCRRVQVPYSSNIAERL